MTAKRYWQDDLLFTATPELPEDLTGRANTIIGRREATTLVGHGREVEETQARLFLEARRVTPVVPQEHHPIHFPEGFSRVIQQRESTPLAIGKGYN
jgi:hypothetical protein